jgi:8-amino-7-oxononanoate synthase
MRPRAEQGLAAALQQRRRDHQLRSLSMPQEGIDFCSNDYLGLARSERLRDLIEQQSETWGGVPNGSTGSRLISGNSALAETLEQELADFHGAAAGLLFSSGYAANTGLYSAVARAGDCLVMDELIHASCIDGARLSKAEKLIFRHNDLDDLQRKVELAQTLTGATGQVWVGVESIYSMDGNCAPLEAMVKMTAEAGVGLMVDEAHSNGISGPNGAGMVCELGLENEVFARVHTFGKGIGLHGAVVLGSETLKAYLINFSRPFIYSTAPADDQLLKIRAAYTLLPELQETRERLVDLVRHFCRCAHTSGYEWVDSNSWIQSVVVPGERQVLETAEFLQSRGYWVKAIRAPSVAAGAERIRICVHAFNTHAEIEGLLSTLEESREADGCVAVLSPA